MNVERFCLQTGAPHLLEFIRSEIAARGPLPFAWFMEQVLYHPEHGYYSSGRCAIGRAGDYVTSVSVGPLFGRLLAAQFVEMWITLGRPNDFAIVEQGAHGGEFAHDVLTAAQGEHPQFFQALRYVIVEPFRILLQEQKARLKAFEQKLSWSRSLEELAPFRGVHFSNELLDALPVHLLRWTGAEWTERHVSEVDGAFTFVDLPITDRALGEHLRAIPLPLPTGYETEANLAALRWIETLAPKLSAGFIMAVDYGWAREEYYAPQRTTGTLRCSAQHRIVPSPLEQVGQADITAHVEWTSVAQRAESCGLTLAGFTDQHHFITGLLAGPIGKEFESETARSTRGLQTLLHPQHLGMKFQYLLLTKGIDAPERLSGFKFAKDPRRQLGL